jgi:signal transduction histidine kinase
VNPAESVREACAEARVLADAAGVRLEVGPLADCTVCADDSALRRLWLILLDNAIKYTPEGGGIRVAVAMDGESAVVEVRDSGIGIPADDLPHIFERFYRAAKDRSRQTGGAGLGLSIAQWIAEKLNGQILVESEYGVGSVFRVRLPLAADSSAVFQNEPRESNGGDFE